MDISRAYSRSQPAIRLYKNYYFSSDIQTLVENTSEALDIPFSRSRHFFKTEEKPSKNKKKTINQNGLLFTARSRKFFFGKYIKKWKITHREAVKTLLCCRCCFAFRTLRAYVYIHTSHKLPYLRTINPNFAALVYRTNFA